MCTSICSDSIRAINMKMCTAKFYDLSRKWIQLYSSREIPVINASLPDNMVLTVWSKFVLDQNESESEMEIWIICTKTHSNIFHAYHKIAKLLMSLIWADQNHLEILYMPPPLPPQKLKLQFSQHIMLKNPIQTIW